MNEVTLGSVSAIVRFLETRCFVEGNVLFRGQAADWPLLPAIARIRPRREEGLLFTEQRLLRAFQRRSLPFLEMKPADAWDWLAVAQHHGLPTRLLDWTVNALAALWFVVQKPARRDPMGTPLPGVLWVFLPREGRFADGSDYIDDPAAADPFALERPAVLVPRYVSQRIVAQGGYFTVHPHAGNPPHFAAFNDQYAAGDRPTKILIPPESFPVMRHNLVRLGMNSMAIYPDLEGLCQDIAWRYAYKEDESDALWDDDGVDVPGGDEPASED